MVEVALLAMRDEAVRDRVQQCVRPFRQVDQGIALAPPEQLQRRQCALRGEHGIDEDAVGAQVDQGDFHEAMGCEPSHRARRRRFLEWRHSP